MNKRDLFWGVIFVAIGIAVFCVGADGVYILSQHNLQVETMSSQNTGVVRLPKESLLGNGVIMGIGVITAILGSVIFFKKPK